VQWLTICFPYQPLVQFVRRGRHESALSRDGHALRCPIAERRKLAETRTLRCDFWSQDDGWQGLCKSLSLTVRGNSFEDAKENMVGELQLHIEKLLREHARSLSGESPAPLPYSSEEAVSSYALAGLRGFHLQTPVE
jgi:predicted RNase H-like HicB family nuclease